MPEEKKPGRDWVILPPVLRPFALALSCGIVALFIWDRVAVEPEAPDLHGPAVKVVGENEAPVAQMNVSSMVAGGAVPAAPGPRAEAPSAPGRASGAPLTAPDQAAPMSEEERSARNEEMIDGLEKQKKRMGIAKVLPKRDRAPGVSILGDEDAPAAPSVRSAAPPLLKRSPRQGSAAGAPAELGPGVATPDAGLIFSDARGLASAWVLLGLPGDPPVVDFAARRAVVIKPSGVKIASTSIDGATWTVTYRRLTPDETADPARDRVTTLPLEPKSVQFLDATPR